jgi:hypothetical protein
MMDMMTIILLFLLKTWSVTGALLTPAIDNLPISSTREEARRSLSLVLTSEGLFEEAEVGGETGPGVGRLIVPSEEFMSAESVSLPSLESYLTERRELERELGKLVPSRELTVQAADDIPYAWVLKLINAATITDYDLFEFVVEREAGGRSP